MLEQFQRVPIFAGLSEAGLGLLTSRIQQLTFPADACVLREGDVGNRFYVIHNGRARVCKKFGSLEEVELAVLGPSDFFGEMCILETLPRTATVQTLDPTILFSLSSLDFLHLYEAMPNEYGILVVNIARDLSRRLRKLDERFAARH